MLNLSNVKKKEILSFIHHMFKLPSKERLKDIARLSSSIFGTIFNPKACKTGNHILRQRFRGSILLDYYSGMNISLRDVRKAFPHLNLIDQDEERRRINVEIRKRRGKGPPTKSKVKTISSTINRKKKR